MKYRIKIVTYKNGRKQYYPQFKYGPFWRSIDSDGSLGLPVIGWNYGYEKRESALFYIDRHYDGNSKKQTIQFEYITK